MNIHYLTIEKLRERLASAAPFFSPVIISSENGAKRWGFCSLLNDLHKAGKIHWLSQVEANPTQNTLYMARCALRNYLADGIITIGGGSAIDLAKAISAFYSMPGFDSPESLREAIVDRNYFDNANNALPVIAVPTTAGTGSEVTQWATVWDAEGDAKYSVDAPWLKPMQAWIAPQLAASLPSRLMLAAGLDAVCHAAEAYWALSSNPLAKALAIRSLQLITNSLKPCLANPKDEKLLENLCTGSLTAGFAFSATRTTACHSISYPLTYMFGMEHGFAAAVTLAQIAAENSQVCDIAEVEEVFSQHGGIHAWIDFVCESIVDLRLRAFKVNMDDMNRIAANSFSAGRMDNNPAELTIESVKKILIEAW